MRALTAYDEAEIRDTLADLRFVLHQHIQQLRKDLGVVYLKSVRHPQTVPFAAAIPSQRLPESKTQKLQRLIGDIPREQKSLRN